MHEVITPYEGYWYYYNLIEWVYNTTESDCWLQFTRDDFESRLHVSADQTGLIEILNKVYAGAI